MLNSLHVAAVLLLASAGAYAVSAPPSQLSADQVKVLESATVLALAYTRNLPNFICTQITHRDTSALNNQISRSGGSNGMQVAASLSSSAYSSSVIEERLTFFDQKENYEVVAIDGRKAARVQLLHDKGAISAGEFGSALHSIFDPQSHTAFTWERTDKLRGRQVYVFAYQVPKESGALVIHKNPDQQIVVSYNGRIFVDASTSEVTRITSRLALPVNFPIQVAERVVDYKQTAIAGKTFNLPSHSEVRMQDGSNIYENKIDFKSYQRFAVESTIRFGGSLRR